MKLKCPYCKKTIERDLRTRICKSFIVVRRGKRYYKSNCSQKNAEQLILISV